MFDLTEYQKRIIAEEYLSTLEDRFKIMLINELMAEIKQPLKSEYQSIKNKPINKKIEIKQPISSDRGYHKKGFIIELFNKYHNSTKTKKEVFMQIANELNITVKAVEKAYYSKQ